MTVWFTSDHHFGHANVIKYTNRPFSSVEEMDDELIRRWNERIKINDVVYHLGDFSLLSFKYVYEYLDRLNGHIFLVPGGHDERWIRHKESSDFVTHLLPALVTIKHNGFPIVLCHYPMLTWDRSHYGSLHLHGHSHGNIPIEGNRMDVGVDTNEFYPYNLEEILEILNDK
jgi:calcineurin-like phosphoesterase family protein